MSNALKKITRRAKQMRRKSPSSKWTTLIKRAGAEYRAGKLGATLMIERGETKRTKPKRTVRVTRTKKGTFKKMSTIGSAKSTLRDHYKNQLAQKLLQRDQATTKRDRKRLSKDVAKARSNFKKFA